MKPRSALLLVLALALCVAAGTAAALRGDRVLREIAWFEVRQVEVSGTRLLAPHEVLAASRIGAGLNLWEELPALEAALLEHPMVESARVTRRLPHTLRIRIEEKRPVALLEHGTLRLVTARGEILPVDPIQSPRDLPLVRGADLAEPADSAAWILAEIDRLAALDPALLADVSEIRPLPEGGRALLLSHAAAEIVLPAGADVARLGQLRAVLLDLERRAPATAGPRTRPRLDVRFADQIVVRIPFIV